MNQLNIVQQFEHKFIQIKHVKQTCINNNIDVNNKIYLQGILMYEIVEGALKASSVAFLTLKTRKNRP